MKNINNEVFLSKINQKINNGDFDMYLTIPFMSRDLLYLTIKGKITKKIATGGTPILNDSEVKECLADVKETSVYMLLIFTQLGFIEKTETGFEFTAKGELAVRSAYTLK